VIERLKFKAINGVSVLGYASTQVYPINGQDFVDLNRSSAYQESGPSWHFMDVNKCSPKTSPRKITRGETSSERKDLHLRKR